MQGMRTSGARRAVTALMAVIVAVGGLLALDVVAAGADASITSSGPLTQVGVGTTLNCSANHVGDTAGEFFNGTSCGTWTIVDGVLYGPFLSASAYTPVSQTGPTGSGTASDPYKIVTVVDLGATGVRLTQTDTYTTGLESFRTDVALANTSGSSHTVRVYRAADCYLQNSDSGYGAYDAGTDTVVTYLDQLAADASKTVFVVANIPLGRATGDVAGVRLTATSYEATAAGSLGALVTQTAGANTAGVDTVFADTNANGNTARDGIHFGVDDYTVSAANLSATKTSRIISDPFNNTTNPKMIPGAVVEYCVAVTNAAGSATATNIAVSDTLPATTTFDSGFGILLNGTVTSGTCNPDGTAGGSFASGVVSGTLSDINAGVTRTLVFRVTVN